MSRFKLLILIIISSLSIYEEVKADNIYSFLEKGGTNLKEFIQEPHDLKCSYTFDFQEKTSRPTVFFVAKETVKGNKFSVLWELKELPEFLKGSTFENRIIVSGSDLVDVLKDHPPIQK